VEKFTNEKWTKIIKIQDNQHNPDNLFLLVDELYEFMEDPPPIKKPKKKRWELIFDPEKMVREAQELTFDKFRLS
jgi:hypothetical protein